MKITELKSTKDNFFTEKVLYERIPEIKIEILSNKQDQNLFIFEPLKYIDPNDFIVYEENNLKKFFRANRFLEKISILVILILKKFSFTNYLVSHFEKKSSNRILQKRSKVFQHVSKSNNDLLRNYNDLKNALNEVYRERKSNDEKIHCFRKLIFMYNIRKNQIHKYFDFRIRNLDFV